MRILSTALSIFVLMDAIGNIPFYICFLKELPEARQKKIILRELLIALGVIILFALLGEGLMSFLHVKEDTIQIAGGVILFLLCLKMVFPPPEDPRICTDHSEPFIVPLAIPLVAGPGVLAAVMIYARQHGTWDVLGAIFIAWAASLIILLCASRLQKCLGRKGIIAMERLMGLILTLIAIQMFLSGVASFIKNLQ